MTVINTFWTIFKSNADEAIKGNKAIEKSTKETAAAIKNTKDQTDDLGKSFVKMVEGAAGVAGAYAGFSIVKNGVQNAADYNAQLAITAKLTGQTAQNLKTMAQLSAEFGGSREGALADFSGFTRLAQSMGIQNGSPEQTLRAIRARLSAVPEGPNALAQRNQLLNSFNVNDQGLRMALLAPDAEFNAKFLSAQSVSKLSPEDANKALDLVEKQAHLSAAEGNLFTTIGNNLIPSINTLVDKISGLINRIAGNDTASVGTGAGIIAGSAVGTGLAARWGIRAARGLSGTISGAAEGIGAAATGTAALAVGTVAGFGAIGYYAEKWRERAFSRSNAAPVAPLAKGLKTGSADLDFWRAQGYTSDQAAAIMANLSIESAGLNPAARGDGGQAVGLAQWHPDRVAAILKGTGIDVRTAGYKKQLEAVAWEMKNGDIGFDDAKFRGLSGAGPAGSYFSTNFERPLDRTGQAILRGKAALGLAAQYGSANGGNTTSVKIDKIEVNTQATDADGISRDIGNQLSKHLTLLAANFNDGRAM